MRTSTASLTALLAFLGGILLGFLLAPIRRGIGNNCGNHIHIYDGDSGRTGGPPENGAEEETLSF